MNRTPNRSVIVTGTGGTFATGANRSVEGLRNMLATEAVSQERMENGKEIKVKIPVGYHIKLHTLKVLKGQSISDTVEIALQKYFAQNPFPEMQALAQRPYGRV